MGFDRKYLLWALGYAVLGICVGIYMAASGNHGELVAHAHILLVGFVVSFIYAIIHKLWLVQPGRTIALIQFIVHQVSAIVLFAGLLLLYANAYPEATLEPFLSAGSLGVLLGVLLMVYMVLKFGAATRMSSAA